MKDRTKRLLITVIVLTLMCCSIAAWTAIRVVAWARDLPSRLVVDGDGLGIALGSAIAQWYHEGLINGDAQMQIQIIRDFTTLVARDADAREWIRTEYSADLQRLSSSADAGVATLAAELLELLEDPASTVRLFR